jgi:hypothetical protein
MKSITVLSIPLLYILIGVAFILPKIPIIGKFFNIINTAIHELGHALMALLIDGKVHKIELLGDSSGVTVTQSKSKFGSFLIALAGYPFAAATGWLFLFMNSVGYEKGVVVGLPLLFLIMLMFWIRNIYGIIWTLLFIGLNVFLIYYDKANWIMIAANFYAIAIIIESLSSSFAILYLSFFRSDSAGDATNLQKITHIPTFFWGALFCAFSCFMGYWCWKLLF